MHFEKSREPATVATVNRPSNDLLPGEINSIYSAVPSLDQAARKLAARYGLTTSVARLVVELAGLGDRRAA